MYTLMMLYSMNCVTLNQHNIGICSDVTEPTFFSHRGSIVTIDCTFTSHGIISNCYTSVSNDNCLVFVLFYKLNN